MEYELSIAKPASEWIGYLNIAIITESNSGETRNVHPTDPQSNIETDGSIVLKVNIDDPTTIIAADKITLCAMLKSGGIVSQAYLFKDHLCNHMVRRVVDLYTMNYDKRIRDDVNETIMGKFNKDADRKAQQLMAVSIRLSTPNLILDGDQKPHFDMDYLKLDIKEHGKTIENETAVMLELDHDIKDAVIRRMGRSNLPMVEVVLLRAPQQLYVEDGLDKDGCAVIKSKVPNEYCVPRSAYFSLAIGNTIVTPSGKKTSVKHPPTNITTTPIQQRALDVLELVNLASRDLPSAIAKLGPEMPSMHEMLLRCNNSFQEHSMKAKRGLGKTGISPAHVLANDMVDCLWADLFTNPNSCYLSNVSEMTADFFAFFMPLNHGEYGPSSHGDPYQLDQSFIPNKDGSGGKLVSTELFFNSDCETLSSRCLSHWRAQRQALQEYTNNTTKLESIVASMDRVQFMAFMLEMVTMATFPVQALIQCESKMGEHVTHCRCMPCESWNKPNGVMCDIYNDGISLIKDCKRVISIAIGTFAESNTPLIETESINVDQLLEKVHALYGHKHVRVQDCTVACKTPNSFGFLTKLEGFYPYVHCESRVKHFAPSNDLKNKSHRCFKKMIEDGVLNPDLLFVPCDSLKTQNHVQQLAQLQHMRLLRMRGD